MLIFRNFQNLFKLYFLYMVILSVNKKIDGFVKSDLYRSRGIFAEK